MKPRYIICIDERDPAAIAGDEESQHALFTLIEQRSGINRTAAQALLDTGKMLVTRDLVAVREDITLTSGSEA